MTDQRQGKLFVISAPSGSGKTTLAKKLLAGEPRLGQSISATTRPPRPGEKDGVDYIFVSEEKFEEMAKRGEFLEHEENFGHRYGTPKRYVDAMLKNGKSVLLSIDVKGAMKVKRAYPSRSVLIFILPPSMKTLEKRLRARMSEAQDAISARINIAKKELGYKNKYDHRVINDDLSGAYDRLRKIVSEELKFGG